MPTIDASTGSAAIAATAAPGMPVAMREAARQFEDMVLGRLLGDFTAGALGSDGGLGPFASLLQDEYARLIGRAGGVGVADAILRALLRQQEAG